MTDLSTQKSLAIAELNPIITDIAAFGDTIESMDVFDDETQALLGDFVKMLMSRRKKIESKRTSLVKPLNAVVKDINGLFKAPVTKIDSLMCIARDKMNKYAKAKQAIAEAKRKAEQQEAENERREALELAEALRKKVDDADASEVVEEIVQQTEIKLEKTKAPAKVVPNRGDNSSVITTKKWKAEVKDILALAKAVSEGRLPVTVIEPNMRALNDISKETKQDREVDGVRYYLEVSTQVR